MQSNPETTLSDGDLAKLELKTHTELYQFYINCYLKGAAVFLAIMGALFKFALDPTPHRRVFAVAGLSGCALIVFPLIFAFSQERRFRADFNQLANRTKFLISTSAFFMLCITVTGFLAVVIAGWLYVYFLLAD